MSLVEHESNWTMEHLRGAQRIAADDAAASDRLMRQIRQGHGDAGDDGSVVVVFCECGAPCRPNTLTGICDRCCKRNSMRLVRAGKTQKGNRAVMHPCASCRVPIRTYINCNFQTYCAGCRRKPMRWRLARQAETTP